LKLRLKADVIGKLACGLGTARLFSRKARPMMSFPAEYRAEWACFAGAAVESPVRQLDSA
jgi:hypothetical protein